MQFDIDFLNRDARGWMGTDLVNILTAEDAELRRDFGAGTLSVW